MDREFLRSKANLPSDVDPRTIKVFGMPGGLLPQPNNENHYYDPQEIAIYVSGESDGTLDEGDYVLFYAEGPHRLTLTEGHPSLEQNIYSDSTYILLTYGGDQGKRITQRTALTSTSSSDTYTQYIVHGEDLISPFRTGRKWFYQKFYAQESRKTYEFETSDADSLSVWIEVASNSTNDNAFEFALNDEPLGSVTMTPILDLQYGDKFRYESFYEKALLKSDDIRLSISLNISGIGTAYLDYFILGIHKKASIPPSGMYIYRDSGQVQSYRISNSNSAVQMWNVSNPLEPIRIPASNDSNSTFTADHSETRLVAVDPSALPAPYYVSRIANQNLKSNTKVDGIIVTHPLFLPQANRLAAFHQSFDGLSVAVATTTEIYNEFAAGREDLTAIRNYLKYCYDNGGLLKYALLFGDATYDYKQIQAPRDHNFVPIYQSFETSHNVLSHSSDDYLSFMEDDEGGWSEGVRKQDRTNEYLQPYQDHTSDIGIGRLPVKSADEAEALLDKIIRYKTAPQAYGPWRTRLVYLADDGDNSTHMRQAESFSSIVDNQFIQYSTDKLYLDRFEQPDNAQENAPAREALKAAIHEGIFILNYMGHGNHLQLTDWDELVVTKDMIMELTNRHKLPFVVTATCDFGKYDNPTVVSGAEEFLLNPDGGAIGLLTTTRPVYSNTNFPVNESFHYSVFQKIDGRHPRLGDVIMYTKNNSLEGLKNRNFALLGDPMLQLNYPEYDIVLDQFTETDTLSALQEVTISGRIVNGNSTVTNFNGKALLNIWDLPQSKVTLGDENDPFQFRDQTNALYRGELTVKDGMFASNIILPKSISYSFESGKLDLYAWNADDRIDASTATKNFVLGGSAEEIADDHIPPAASLYLNDPTFRQGDVVGPSSLLIAKLSDEHGINISTNGFNSGLTLQLNDEEPFEVNKYYTADLDTYKKGTLLVPLEGLKAGNYTAQLKVWDAYNNSAEYSVKFKVSEAPVIRLYNTKNYPNPISQYGETTFSFEHDRAGEDLMIQFFIYDMQGSQVHGWEHTLTNSPRNVSFAHDLSNLDNGVLDKGIYLYRIRITSSLDGATNEVIKRLIVIN
ncbi:putative secreted protein (Por secretion system target) [Marinoscillum furvescens DSM 4134]|uniref:Putative secreted protein (Por secretion system target) n=2 Tax=Marinoscillum furvescens TaxID=1026 RepID=A0A3D9L5C4_MARFU|nr:putative secreted protein (Por secretion system target) [Marinoscillum furvescens DSM 4134]